MRNMLTLLLVLMLCHASASDRPIVAAAPSWIVHVKAGAATAPQASDVSNGYYISRYERQINIALETEYISSTREILNETGVLNASEVSVFFSPEYQQVVFHHITVTRDGHEISKLNLSQIKVVQEETESDDYVYNGRKRAFVILKDIQKSDRITFAYSIKGFNPAFDGKFSRVLYLTADGTIQNYSASILVPKNSPLYYKVYNDVTQPEIRTEEVYTVYQWAVPLMKNGSDESGVPSWFDSYPRVSLSQFSSWGEVVSWANALFNDYNYQLSPAMTEKVKLWKKLSAGNRDEYARLAIRFVQDEVRYLGLEMGVNSHKPHHPAETFQQRFGDCKDKSLLLVTLLRANSIPSYVSLVSTTLRSKTPEELPSSSLFDHAIVAMERNGRLQFIDATTMYQRGPVNEIYLPAYGAGLVIRPGDTTFQSITPMRSSTVVKAHLNVTSSDSCQFRVNSVFSGGQADDLREKFFSTSLQEISDSYRDFYKKDYPEIRASKLPSIVDDTLKNQVTLTESYVLPSIWYTNKENQKGIDVNARELFINMPDPDDCLKDAPINLRYPLDMDYTLVVRMPENWSFSEPDIEIKTNSYFFSFSSEVSGRQVTLHYKYVTFKDHIPVEELTSYKEEYSKVSGLWKFNMYLNEPAVQSASKSNTTRSEFNQVMVWALIFGVVGSSFFFRHYNYRSAHVYVLEEEGRRLQGWILLLGLTIAGALIVSVYTIYSSGYLANSTWSVVGQSGGTLLQGVLLIEFAGLLIPGCLAGMMLYWFIRRRDIFPYMFMIYIGLTLMMKLILMIAVYMVVMPQGYEAVRPDAVTSFFRTLVYCAIWGTYVYRSQQVRETFRFPHASQRLSRD